MHIKTLGLKGPFHVVSDDGGTLSTQPDFECALAYVQGIFDCEVIRDPHGHAIEIHFDRRLGYSSNEFSVTHCGPAKYLVGNEEISGAAPVLEYCLGKSPRLSFVATLSINDNYFTFDKDKENSRANEIYNQQRFGDT